MANKVKVTAKARYGQIGNYVVPFEVAKASFERLGYEVVDLGNGVLEYTFETERNNPYIQETGNQKEMALSLERE